MLGLFSPFENLQQWFGPTANPIGVDLGTDSIRMAQVQMVDGEPQLVAAAMRDVPPDVVGDPQAYASYLARTLRELWREGKFLGRRAVLSLPSSMTHLLHLRLPKMDAAGTAGALPFELVGKLPFDPMSAMLRHHVIGEVYTNDGPRQEILCTAARRDHVELLLTAAEKAKLEVVGMSAAPVAINDCFSRIYRRESDGETGFCFVDIGKSATRVTVSRAGHLYFARSIPIGADALDEAVAEAVHVQPTEARLLRVQLAAQQSEQAGQAARRAEERAQAAAAQSHGSPVTEGLGMLSLATQAESREALHTQSQASVHSYDGGQTATAVAAAPRTSTLSTSLITDLSVASAMAPVIEALGDELNRCRRYHEATFPHVPVDRLVFVGGEAHQRGLCQSLAQRMHVAAQVGDPIARLCHEYPGRAMPIDFVAAGIDRRRSQPDWAVACGLTLAARS